MYVPMFAVCGTILQPVAYDMSDDQVGCSRQLLRFAHICQDSFAFVDRTFGFTTRQNLHVASNQTMRRPTEYSSAMSRTTPGCFQFKQLLQDPEIFATRTYNILTSFLKNELFRTLGWTENAWQPCIV
jgi:hypothetical protein